MTSLLFRARKTPGFQLDAAHDPRVCPVRKRALRVTVRFASSASRLATPEGNVAVSVGDAIIDDDRGRKWPVGRARFDATYAPMPCALPGEAGTYTSLPTQALAMQMTQPFCVRFADGISELEGRPGDWLLDYGDGNLGVVAADAFQTSYDLV